MTAIRCVTWTGYDAGLRAGDYLRRAGIDLESVYVGDDDSGLARVREGGIDLGSGPEVEWVRPMAREGLCAPLDPARLPNLARVHRFFADNPLLNVDGKQFAVPFTWGMIPMLYRPDRIAPPASWRDVLRPEFKGRVAMTGGPWGNLRLWGHLVTGANAGRMTRAQLEQTVDFLIDLKTRQALGYFPDFKACAEAMATRDAVVSTFGWEPMVGWAAAAGAPLAMAFPNEGTIVYIDVCFMVPGTAHADAVHALIDRGPARARACAQAGRRQRRRHRYLAARAQAPVPLRRPSRPRAPRHLPQLPPARGRRRPRHLRHDAGRLAAVPERLTAAPRFRLDWARNLGVPAWRMSFP
jgi:hypothetical protein